MATVRTFGSPDSDGSSGGDGFPGSRAAAEVPGGSRASGRDLGATGAAGTAGAAGAEDAASAAGAVGAASTAGAAGKVAVKPRHAATLARSVRLLTAFRREQTDPESFYGLMARDTVAQLSSYTDLEGAIVVDVGTGPGYFAREMAAHGARCTGIDLDLAEMTAHGAPARNSLVASALALPFRTGSADVCFSSNVLEHVPDPWRMAQEMVRVTRPGGIVFLSFTNWLSPWGGHETSPWHYLGGERAARRYERRNGRPPKNRFGKSLHPVSVSAALAWARSCREAELLDALPRYHPRWAGGIVRIPGVREIATWNLLLVLRKLPGTSDG